MRTRIRFLVCFFLTVCASFGAGFTLEQILGAAFPSELTAAPAGARVAWVLDARGVRNIWVADGPAWHGRAVTSYKEDDGQEISALAWAPGGDQVVYVRGGGPNGKGEIPNPTHNPEAVHEAVCVVAAGGGEPRQLGEGSGPAVAPKGRRVAWVKQGKVWGSSLDGTGKAAELFWARGNASSLGWSPDGTKLAFVSGRGDHSFIGVFDTASRTVSYLDPSVDRDVDPAWSSDGTKIAFIRIPARKAGFLFGAEREGEPWSIRIADVATGTARELWRAERGRGSVFHEVVANHQLQWMDGRIVFPWERDGWTHLYAVPASGGTVSLLTPGAFEVEHVSVTPDRRELVYSSNQGDIERRHLWRVKVSGGAPAALTSGKGVEWSPVITAEGDALAFLRSDARRPAHAVVMAAGATHELAAEAIPADFPSASLVEPREVTFSAADGLEIHAQLFLPAGVKPGDNRPAAIFLHGGSRRQMLPAFHYMYYYHNAYALNEYLASLGYVVLAVNYRSGIGYGMEFREALNYGATGASEFQDVLGAGLYLRSRPEVDGKRIGLWGGSYGGYLTAMGLSRASDLFAVGVDMHGVHDWNVVIRNFVPTYDPSQRGEAKLAFESSPMASVKDWRSPVLLIHGDDDRNVPFSETVTLAEALRRQGVQFEQLIFPDEIHDFLRHATWLRAYQATVSFLDRHLRK